MKQETKVCQNCKSDFVIESEDFNFYEKMKVPAPTFCPECRMIRRMNFRNERSLYHRKCDATGKDIITMFAPEQPFVVYEHSYWWSDKWDQLATGRDYDFSKPFFTQFRELLQKAPLPTLANSNVINSDYSNHNADSKNCYLVYACYKNEDLAYSAGAVNSKNSLDVYNAFNTVDGYEDVLCGDVNRVFFSYDSDESVSSAFLYVCKNMIDSLGCINLRNKSYYIFNQPYSKEEYIKERAKYDFGSFKALTEFKEEFKEFIGQYPRRQGSIFKSIDVVGDNIINAKNVYMGFDIFGNVQDSKYVMHAIEARDIYDAYGAGGNLSNAYEVVDTGLEATQNLFAVFTHTCQNVHYTYACHNSKDLFGCVGLRNKQYCILNKQYTKEEYEALVLKIIEHMNTMPYIDSKGRTYKYGEFFPSEISPFAYNETITQEYFPLTKQQVIEKGYRFKEPEVRSYKIDLQSQDLPDHIKDVEDSIIGKVIACGHKGECLDQCTTAFKIIPSELQFYKKMNLALPRLCPNCRHYERLRQRNPLKLWHRTCAKCSKEIQTSYAPERKEIVYCEQCYQQEVV